MTVTPAGYLAGPWTDAAHPHTLPAVLARRAAELGDAVAVTDARQERSWATWRAEALALAAGLQDLGVGPGEVVAVRLPNCWEFLVAHAALAEIGAVLLPLHAALGPGEVGALLERTDAGLLLAPPEHRPGAARRVLTVGPDPAPGTFAELMKRFAGRVPEPVEVTPEHPLVLMPSSGTTSRRPKICVHSHGGLLANAAAVAGESRAMADDVLVSAAPFTHLFGLLAVHLGLLTGGRQALLEHWDPDACTRLARASRATVLFAVPAHLRDLVRRAEPGTLALREVRTGGTAVPGELVARVREVLGARTVIQWGMSELGAGTFTRPGDPAEAVAATIGRPVPGAQARVVAADGTPCADGTTGELQFRGPHLFRGYLDDPAATGAALTPDGWLRTGDRALRRPDGNLVYRGRDAELINVGGLKFTASEVETELSALPQPSALAVAARTDARLGEYPVLLVALRDGTALGLDQVHALLAERGVARYKWPLDLVVIDRIPSTPSGKVARARLTDLLAGPATAPATAPAAGPPAEPSDPGVTRTFDEVLALIETELAALGRPPAEQPTDGRTGFRALGLDSAGAVRLTVRLAELLGRPVAGTAAFDHPSPRELARALTGPSAPRPVTTPRRVPGPSQRIDDDPVVITGIGCRFPGGVDSPEALWQLLDTGRDTLTDLPQDRGWDLDSLYHPEPGRPGRSYVRAGSFLAEAAAFDAAFFGIPPREALRMDPQQRLLLETGWEALERAGIDPTSLHGAAAGVYLGVMAGDYAPRVGEAPELYDGQLLTGTASSVASGRLAYQLGLTGPALSIDTACSSSLVAIHLAARALRDGEVDLALAGGATVMSTPAAFVDFARQRALAPDGRCKPFAPGADGTGWGEGAAVLVLQRLSDARAGGHPVLAEVAGSAVNQDGASNGLTAPSGPAQQQVIRQALRDAGLTPDQVDAVEAHGTGTPLGDRIEAGALDAVFGGPDRPADRPLWLGSVKSNLGHTQAAAGVAGVIKTVLALHHATLPGTLHIDGPELPPGLADGALALLHRARPWPSGDRPRHAGVSAFGISGTNAHVVLGEPPADPAPATARETGTAVPWVLSAQDPQALRTAAGRLAAAVRAQDRPSPAAVGHALLRTRPTLRERAVVVGADRDALLAGLDAVAAGGWAPGTAIGRAGRTGGAVFVFPGQGSRWRGTADGLAEAFPAFARSLDATEAALAPHIDWSLTELLRGGAGAPPPDRPDVAQPAYFAVLVALAALWESFGVRPDAVVGHSQGEIAAAHVCGALSLADAARLVAVRARQVRQLAPGAMAAVALTEEQLTGRLAGRPGIGVAARNSPRSAVVAGDTGAVERLVADLTGDGVSARLLPAGYASHCAAVEALADTLPEALAGITAGRGATPFYSTVEAHRLDTARLDPGYWYRNLRRPVRFADTVRTLLADGHRRFVEVGPHPLLAEAVAETAQEAGVPALAVPTLVAGEPGPQRFLLSAAELHVAGTPVDWTGALPDVPGARVELPTYPFQHRRYWLGTARTAPTPVLAVGADDEPADPTGHGNAPDPFDLVLSHTAAVLGHPSDAELPADATFQELGFGSMAAVELRTRLGRELGLALRATAVFDHPTPRRLADHLTERLCSGPISLGGQADADAAETEAELPDSVGTLYREALRSGRGASAVALARATAALRATFGSDRAADRSPRAVTLPGGPAADPGLPVLLCVPSVLPTGGPHEYRELARHFRGPRTAVLPLPGFTPGELLPADLPALAAAHAESLRRHDPQAPVLLCGHSSGGLLAHLLAHRLERLGRPARGLVLLDTPWPDADFHATTLPAVLALLADRPGPLAAEAPGAGRLSATGGYLHLLERFTPEPVATPTLLVRAALPLPGVGPLAHWELPHTATTAPGDHLTLLTEHAPTLARVIEGWAADLPATPSRSQEPKS
ncbi:beta-ketoacyl synthase N-terminal-like domain-containing protein [Kitasatospora sp. NPDC096077]|uniref:type I polyketide synthase n=1 Tax=Kitasatospora sp. NPDC096077 TaxID=3155544 RepID=UPI0033267AFA